MIIGHCARMIDACVFLGAKVDCWRNAAGRFS
jgi:hypothetical protein